MYVERRTIDCTIERLHEEQAEAWWIGIPCTDVQSVLVLLTAYTFHKVRQIRLRDCNSRQSLRLEWCAMKGCNRQVLALDDQQLSMDNIWLDAIISMLLDVYLSGWMDTAHIDYDFQTPESDITICIEVLPPTDI